MAKSGKISRLQDLPPELVVSIAQYLSGTDLLVLRLVNRDLAAKTKSLMLEECFSEVRIMLSMPNSLERALDIAMHPTLRSRVHSVYVLIDRFQECGAREPHLLDTEFVLDQSDVARRLRESRRAIYARCFDEQENSVRHNTDEALLQRVLEGLEKSRYSLSIYLTGLSGHFLDRRSSRDYDDLVDNYGCKPLLIAETSNHRPIHVVLNAIRDSNVGFSRFHAGCYDSGVPVNMFFSEKRFGGLHKTFEQVEQLSISVVARPVKHYKALHAEDVTAFQSFLAHCAPRLKRLELQIVSGEVDNPNEDDIYEDPDTLTRLFTLLVEDVFFPKLENVSLYTIMADYHEFISFFMKHKGTLSDVRFANIAITGHGGPEDVTHDRLTEQIVEALAAAGVVQPDKDCGVVAWSS